jgi:hypothetical protein
MRRPRRTARRLFLELVMTPSSRFTLTLVLALAAGSALAQAANPAPAGAATGEMATAAPASDKDNYLADRVKFQYATAVAIVDMTANGPDKPVTNGCAPAFTTFKGIGRLKIGSEEHPAFVVSFVAPDEGGRCAKAAGTLVKVNDVVVVRRAAMVGTPPDRYGLTYGTLLVPYKMQLQGDRGLSGKASLGGYLGFRQDRSGITGLALQYVVFAGASSISVAQNVDGVPITQDLTGLSYGVAILGTVKDSFQLGVVVGADRVNRSANYANNNKPWIALSLGFDFSN